MSAQASRRVKVYYARPPYRWGGDHNGYDIVEMECADHRFAPETIVRDGTLGRCPECKPITPRQGHAQ